MLQAADQKTRDETPEPSESAGKPQGRGRSWSRLFSKKWIVGIIVASVLIHGAGFTYYQVWGKARPTPPDPEIVLGAFRFVGEKADGPGIAAAEFSVYVTLLEQADRAGRQQLAAHRFRVQQDVEQLLRHAHSADFEDPNLAELKRQLQEQINQSLGLRAIGDVIITNLKLARGNKAALPVAGTTEAAAWREKPSD